MSDDATVYLGYTVNTVALCSLGCCYGHHCVRSRHVADESPLLEDASGSGFANVRITLDPYHFSFMPNEITQLARDIAESLRVDGGFKVGDDGFGLDEAVQQVLDKVETVGGFDLATYETYDDDDDDDVAGSEDEDEFTDEELDDRWDDDDDEDDEDPL